jgi:hypothetical protein
MMSHPPSHDHPAVHGALLVGTGPVYFSHLPLFQQPNRPHPHDYQVLLEIHMGKAETEAYVADRQKSGERVYTLAPSQFVLPDLVQGPDPLRTFSGTVFRGHFERGGTPILHDVGIAVSAVIYFKKFDLGSPPPATLQYLLFGHGTTRYAAHLITRPPDFDQVVSVSTSLVPGDGQAARFSVESRPNELDARLLEGDTAAGRLTTATGALVAGRIEVLKEWYLETADLAS